MTSAVALCAGYGGLEIATSTALGPLDLIGWSDIDPHSAAVMSHHWPDAEPLGDLTTRTTWPQADIVTAGFPCQPASHAGQRKGTEDDRWIWPQVCDAVRLVGPRLVIVENVPGLATLGGPAVVGDLAALGYRVRWTHVRASDHGAPHRRTRLFIVASDPHGPGLERFPERNIEPHRPGLEPVGDLTLLPTPVARDAKGVGYDGQLPNAIDELALLPTPNASLSNYDEDPEQFLARREQVRQRGINGNGVGLPLGVAVKIDWGTYAAAVARWERHIGRPAPDPLDGRQLAAPFVEWMMGLPEGWVTGPVPERRPALRLLGNGVVPQQAAPAIRTLIDH